MTAGFKVGDRVRLAAFHGTMPPNRAVRDNENYWRLIGTLGTVVRADLGMHPFSKDRGEQVLVQYDVDPLTLGLECHNELPRSLRSFVSDLELL
ncbi:MAG: hypothetical protein AAGH68_04615 [Pseudomonadota bacterium]